MLNNASEDQELGVTEGLLCASSRQSTFISTISELTTTIHNRCHIPILSCANRGTTCPRKRSAQSGSKQVITVPEPQWLRWLPPQPETVPALGSIRQRCVGRSDHTFVPQTRDAEKGSDCKDINAEYISEASCVANAWTPSPINTIHPQSLQFDRC